MSRSSGYEKELLKIALQLSEPDIFEDLVKVGILAFYKKLSCTGVVLKSVYDKSVSIIGDIVLKDTLQESQWVLIDNEIDNRLLKEAKTNDFNFQYLQKHIYIYFMYQDKWLVLIKDKAFSKDITHKLDGTIKLFSKLLEKSQQIVSKNRSSITENNSIPDHLETNIFKNIVDELPRSILVSDLEGSLCYANNLGKEWLGIENNEIKNLKVYDFEKYFEGNRLIKWQQHVKELKNVSEEITNGNIVNYQTGNTIPTEVILKYVDYSGKDYIIANSEDISEKLKIAEKVANEEMLQEMLLKIASNYINSDLLNNDNVINTSLKEIGTFVDADRAYIFSYDLLNNTTSNTYEWCAERIAPEIENLQNIPIEYINDWINAHKRREAFVIDNVQDLPDTGPSGLKAILEPQGIKSLITLPMHNSDRLMGFVGFDSVKKVKKYTQREEKLLFVYAEILVNINLRQKYETELLNQKERFQRIISSIDIGLIEVDKDFNIVFANQSFLRFYKYKWKELEEKNLFNTFIKHEKTGDLKERLFNLPYKDGVTDEIVTVDGTGQEKIVFASIVRNIDENGTEKYLVAIVDLSHQKEMEQQLRESIQKVEEASKAKEVFFANMSHELRTPLNIICGTITEVAKKTNTNDTVFLLNHANSSAKHMLNLVNNILDYAEINAGEIRFERKNFNLRTTIQETFEIFSLLADEKGINYRLSVDNKIHANVTGDYNKLNQVLINLIGNAVKYTEVGEVTIQVSMLEGTKKSQIIGFTIIDSGIGMSVEFIERIFEEYQRDILVNNLQSGTGLGMPISKKLIEIMGGTIKVNSTKSSGTIIHFNLPFEKSKHNGSTEKIKVNSTVLKTKHILIAEDNYMNALILERKLKSLGAKVTKAENGQIALNLIPNINFDLILMDIQMPVMDGLNATISIRETYGDSIPILAITANVFRKNINQYLASGMNDVVIKPYEDNILYSKIFKVLDIKLQHETNEIETVNKELDIAPDLLFSLDNLRTISNGDSDFYEQLRTVFIKLIKTSIKELQKALIDEDWITVKNNAHKLRVSLEDLKIETALAIAIFLDTNEKIDPLKIKEKTSKLIEILKIVLKTIND